MNRNYLSEALLELNKLEDATKEYTKRIHEGKEFSLKEDWSSGIILRATFSMNEAEKAHDAGTFFIGDDNSIKNYIGGSSYKVYTKANHSNKVPGYVSVYEDKVEYTLPIYDEEIKQYLNGGIYTLNKAIKNKDISLLNDTIDEFKSILNTLGIRSYRITIELSSNDHTFIDNLTEDLNRVSVETDDTTTEILNGENGEVSVTTTPTSQEPEEVVQPVDDDLKDEIMLQLDKDTETTEENAPETDSEEFEEEEEFIDDAEELVEENFNNIIRRYLTKIYENVNDYSVTSIISKGNTYLVEGRVGFKSGKSRDVKFLFESSGNSLIGKDVQLSKDGPTFSINGSVKDKKFITESLHYSFGKTRSGIIK